MAFKTTLAGPTPRERYPRAKQLATDLKKMAILHRDRAIAGSLPAGDLVNFLHLVANTKSDLVDAKGNPPIALRDIPGIVAYAQADHDDPTYDVKAAFNAMIAEMDTFSVFAEANFPVDADGHLQMRKFVGDGSGLTVNAIITDATALLAVKNRLIALIATLE